MAVLKRFRKNLGADRLVDVLGGGDWPSEALEVTIETAPVREAIDALDSGLSKSEIDVALVQPVHEHFPLDRRTAADPKLWQRVCAVDFPDLVWRRWHGSQPEPDELRDALTSSMCGRFLCKPTLNGISRNTVARLWWAGAAFEGDYDKARAAVSNQDMFQNIFERSFGTYPPAARACLDRFDGRPEAEIRAASRWLQQCLSTTELECLDENQIGAILDEALP